MSSNITVKRNCEYCEIEFLAQTTKTRYCSKKCNSAAYKQKKRLSKISQPNSVTPKVKTVQKYEPTLNDKELLTIPQTASFLGVSRQTVYNWLNNGTIIGKRMSNRKVLILKADLISIFEENKVYEQAKQTEQKPITEFYTIDEIKTLFSIGNSWAFKIIRENNIPKTRIGGKTHVSKKHIDNYFKTKKDDVSNITEWYTVQEIQDKYTLTRDQVYSRTHDNNIPRQRKGKFVQISKQHFDELFIIGE